MNLLSFIRAKHNLVFKLFLVALVSFLVSLMLPNRTVKGHRVDSFTAIWPYNDLITEQEFYIRKTPEELKNEKLQLEQENPLFFERNLEDMQLKLAKLEALIDAEMGRDDQPWITEKPLLLGAPKWRGDS